MKEWCEVEGVDGGVLRLISPDVPVRLESAPAGFAIRAAPAIDDAPHAAAHPLFHPVLYTLHPIPCS
jgi:hypothetical protein